MCFETHYIIIFLPRNVNGYLQNITKKDDINTKLVSENVSNPKMCFIKCL